MNTATETKIAFSVSTDFALRGKNPENYDIRILNFPGWEDVGFFAGTNYNGKVPKPIYAIGDLERIETIDYLYNDKRYFIVSKLFIDTINNFDKDEYNLFPVRVYQSNNLNEINQIDLTDLNERLYVDSFFILQCKKSIDILDKKHSKIEYFDFSLDDGTPVIADVSHFEFINENNNSLPSIFQIPELTQYFVSNSAKSLLEQKNISGLEFDELP
jgi:hypothetical protein